MEMFMILTQVAEAQPAWITTVNGLIALITGLLGLIGTGIGAFFTIKSFIQKNKDNTAQQNWKLIMQAADAAMKVVEHSDWSTSADKKNAAINIVKESCEAIGLDITMFADQLSAYIDQCINWYNQMNKKDQ